jgi:hypothetical protein
MKKALWIVWLYAVLWNGYATWLWVDGFVRVGVPRTDLYSYVVIFSPAISVIALLWAIPRYRSTRATI